MKVILATTNPHKIREIKALLRPLALDLYTLADFPHYQPPTEEGQSFEEIAKLKATHAASALQCYVIADDSGLVVPALGGAPNTRSARYAGDNSTDKANRKKLLEEMKGLSEERRSAYFECAIALASPQGLIKSVKGSVEGNILTEERGGHGFGYDPLFVKHDYRQTFAELSEETKNRISHRGKALNKLFLFLESFEKKS